MCLTPWDVIQFILACIGACALVGFIFVLAKQVVKL
jgi:hypothetical protein